MSDQPMRLAVLDDAALEATLRAAVRSIEWPVASPAAGPDIAARVRARLVADPRPARRRPWTAWRPVRRSLVLALAALLVLAAIAGAVGLGLPGLHLTLGEPPASAPPSATPGRTIPAGPPGSTLGLGTPVSLDAVEAATGVVPRLPADPAIGPPDSIYVDPSRANQVAYVWAPRPGLPETGDPGVGLILMQFDGQTADGYHEKLLGLGVTAEPVTVDGRPGFWISGDPHFFFYHHPGDPSDATITDDRRWVGDALVWTDGATTYRIESAIGRDATIAMARSLE
jgi:hypothetical protein